MKGRPLKRVDGSEVLRMIVLPKLVFIGNGQW